MFSWTKLSQFIFGKTLLSLNINISNNEYARSLLDQTVIIGPNKQTKFHQKQNNKKKKERKRGEEVNKKQVSNWQIRPIIEFSCLFVHSDQKAH